MNWRMIAVIVMLSLSFLDLALTYHYVNKYRNWQSEKPFNLMENNPLLVFLWNTFGLHLGMLIGSVIILSLIYIIAKTAHPIVIGIVFLMLCYALFNHFNNITLLGRLITKYPSGVLPEAIFGKVIGNNK
jgi:uncharacterized protein YacL